ncbi:MAG: hypothetical protein ACI9K5_001094, partial [Gammaproteobacteria bacterium]
QYDPGNCLRHSDSYRPAVPAKWQFEE